MPRALLVGGNRGVGQQLDGRAHQLGGVAVADHRAVHLGQLAQALGREVDIEGEAAGGHGLDGAVVSEDEQSAGAPAQDSLEPITQDGAGRDLSDRRAARGLEVGR